MLTVRPTCFEACALTSNVEVENVDLENVDLSSVSFVTYDESKSDRPELTSAKSYNFWGKRNAKWRKL